LPRAGLGHSKASPLFPLSRRQILSQNGSSLLLAQESLAIRTLIEMVAHCNRFDLEYHTLKVVKEQPIIEHLAEFLVGDYQQV